MKKIYKAAKHGTFSSPTDSQIIYVDPKHADERHHSPRLDAKEAAYAFERGLIEDPEEVYQDIHGDDDLERDPNAIAAVAVERTAEFADADATTGAQASTLESRSSTAWPDRDRVEGGADGFVAGVGLNGDASKQPTDHVSTAGDREEEVDGDEEVDLGDVDQESGDEDAAPAPAARAAPTPAPAPAPAPTPAPKPTPAPAPAKAPAKPAAAPKPVKSENP
jgi:hypothetical protein